MYFPLYLCGLLPVPALAGGQWSGWGGNIFNNRWSESSSVSSLNIHSLTQHCQISYPSGVSATPVVVDEVVYYPTWNGSFVALDYTTCRVRWQINVTQVIANYAPTTPLQRNDTSPLSRTSPQIDGEVLYFGTQRHALLVAVNRNTGAFLDAIQVNPHPLAVVTMSPTVWNDQIFVGTSSSEEAAPAFVSGYQCCSFRGNMMALSFNQHINKFTVNWNIYTMPANWSGAGVWGSQPSIDPTGNQLFFATGNTYKYPEEYVHCANETSSCLPPDVLQESVVAVDVRSGKINWVQRLTPLDAFTVACGVPGQFPPMPAVCTEPPGPDADFGMAPAFIPQNLSPTGESLVVVGQKNGNLYAMMSHNGTILWATVTSPGGITGGLSWGVATDDKNVYFTGINSGGVTFQLQPSNKTVSNSTYGAASLASGKLLWETQTPQNSSANNPPTVVGDIVFVGRTLPEGGLVVLDKSTGNIIKDLALDAQFNGGIAVQGPYVMFGTGYGEVNGTGSFHVMKV